uniref:Uncharacterized protein n=1 Tax=Glossina pallidipes TaxID=7398 RepID=A0A1A9ZZM2_GLOPL
MQTAISIAGMAPPTNPIEVSTSIKKPNKKIVLYNPSVDYTAPLQQQINADLIGSHPHVQQYVQQQQQQPQVRQTSSNVNNNTATTTNNNNNHNNNNIRSIHSSYNMNALAAAAAAAAAAATTITTNTTTTNNSNNSLALKLSEQQHSNNNNNNNNNNHIQATVLNSTTNNSKFNNNNNNGNSNATTITNTNATINNYKLMEYNAMKATANLDGCSSGSGSQPSLSPTMMSNNSAHNYGSNSKESLWSQQTSPSTKTATATATTTTNGRECNNIYDGNQLRNSFYIGSKNANNIINSHLNTNHTNLSSNYESNIITPAQQQTVWTSNATASMDEINKISNIWDIPHPAKTQDLFPEIWNNLNTYQQSSNSLTNNVASTNQAAAAVAATKMNNENISDISSNSPLDIWRTQITNTFITSNNHSNSNNANDSNGVKKHQTGTSTCMQLFSDEFLFK